MLRENKIFLIVNPIAGNGKAMSFLPKVTGALKEQDRAFDLSYTERKGDGRALAEKACQDGYGTLVAVGGDGTLSEVVDGVIRSGKQNVRVAAIPAGTGNDFLVGSGLFLKTEDPIRALLWGKDKKVDAIIVQDRAGKKVFAVNSLGFGFDALVVKRVQKIGAKKIGRLGYMFGALRGFFEFNPVKGEAVIDGKAHLLGNLWLLAATNSKMFGGGMKVSPEAAIDDGLLDVSYLFDVPRASLLPLIFLVRQGRHLGRKGVFQSQARSLTVNLPAWVPAHIDGDVFDAKYPVKVGILPGAFTLKIPGGY